MWRPPGEERRQQRRSGAGRHITVLATQPQQIGGIAVRAEVGRTDAEPRRVSFCLAVPTRQRAAEPCRKA